ncbi:hypothetical protein D4Q85_00060 [bacterium]|nr:MAG: hypothetical protein D4Q85_00060 [bacterium]
MPGFTKLRANWEQRYVTDYVLAKYPKDIQQYRVPLGSVPELWIKEMGLGKALKTYRPYRPEADACVITADKIVLIEGKIFKVMDGLAKLPIYRSLVAETPELDMYKSLPVEAVLVTPKEPGWSRRVAIENDITVDIFVPAWIEEYYDEQEKYWTAEERVKRLQRKEKLKRMG